MHTTQNNIRRRQRTPKRQIKCTQCGQHVPYKEGICRHCYEPTAIRQFNALLRRWPPVLTTATLEG